MNSICGFAAATRATLEKIAHVAFLPLSPHGKGGFFWEMIDYEIATTECIQHALRLCKDGSPNRRRTVDP
jgi:hypothetical protein